MPKETKQPKGKSGKILGMPYWAAGLALVLGLVAGYYFLRKSGGSTASASGDSGSQTPQQQDNSGGAGGIPGLPQMSALGITPVAAQNPSEGATNGDTSQTSTTQPTPADTFAAAVSYAHSQINQGGQPLNQGALDIAHQQFAVTPGPISQPSHDNQFRPGPILV